MIEVVIRKRDSTFPVYERYKSSIKPFVVMENNEKVILNVDQNSEWLHTGVFSSMIKEFGELAYVALAYFTSGDELVMDFDGNNIDWYDVTMNNKITKKYVKKKIIIVEEDENVIKMLGYMINLKFSNPIVEILNVYSVKNETGVTLNKVV